MRVSKGDHFFSNFRTLEISFFSLACLIGIWVTADVFVADICS